jgi:hypothetical protein
MAADSTSKVYTVTVNTAATDSKNILGFDILGITPAIGANAVFITVPLGTNVTALTPIIRINGVSVSPASGQLEDFTTPVMYTVKDKTGASNTYMVTVAPGP